MSKYKVSVIVCVYNVERYIERCVRSLLSQTMRPGDLQIIFVDDCSPDGSMEIVRKVLEEYPERNNDVTFVRLEKNSGTAIARRKGHEAVEGEYEIHCDPDDWVETDMYESLYDKAIAENLDIVRCDYDRVDEVIGKSAIMRDSANPKDGQEMAGLILQGVQFGSLCRNLVRHNLYDDGIIWPTHSVTEDTALTFQLYWHANSFGIVPRALYHYRISHNSLTSTPSDESYRKQVTDQIANLSVITDFLKRHGAEERFKNETEWRKLWIKDCAFQMVHHHGDMHIWSDLYPEVNRSLFSNPLVKFPNKVRYLLIELRMPLSVVQVWSKITKQWFGLKSRVYKLIFVQLR